MAIALDTNILVYGAGLHDDVRAGMASRLLMSTASAEIVIPVQALAEFYRILVGKAKWPMVEAAQEVQRLMLSFATADTLASTLVSALTLTTHHAFQVFDAVILASASEAGCEILLSEDMQHGFEWQGVTIINPFAPEPHPLLVAAIGTPH